MKKKIDAAQKVYDKADEAAQVVQKEVKKCDAEIKKIAGGKIEDIRKKKNEASKKYEQFKSEITKLNVEIKGNERNLKKVSDKLENLEAEIKECEDSMIKMKARREQIETEGGQIMADQAEKKAQKDALKEEITNLNAELKEIEKEETTLKSSRIEVDQELTKYDDLVKENTKKVQYWKKELRKLSLQEVPGEEMGGLAELAEEQVTLILSSFELSRISDLFEGKNYQLI